MQSSYQRTPPESIDQLIKFAEAIEKAYSDAPHLIIKRKQELSAMLVNIKNGNALQEHHIDAVMGRALDRIRSFNKEKETKDIETASVSELSEISTDENKHDQSACAKAGCCNVKTALTFGGLTVAGCFIGLISSGANVGLHALYGGLTGCGVPTLFQCARVAKKTCEMSSEKELYATLLEYYQAIERGVRVYNENNMNHAPHVTTMVRR